MRPTQLHIMLADDDEDDRMFFAEAFEEIKAKYTLSVFKDGQQLMDYLTIPENPLKIENQN